MDPTWDIIWVGENNWNAKFPKRESTFLIFGYRKRRNNKDVISFFS